MATKVTLRQKAISGVFNWVLQGLDRLLAQKKFSDCEASRRAIEQYKTESSSIQMFLNENGYKASSKVYELFRDIYFEYRSFCFEEGLTPFKKSNFKKQLESLGYIVSRGSGNKVEVFIEKSGIDI